MTNVRRIGTAVDDGDSMLIAQRRQASITAPAIGVDGRSGHGDVLNKGDQTVRRYVCDAAQANASNATTAFLRSYDDNGFVFGLTSTLPLFRAADVGVVNLDLAAETIAAGADHRSPQLMQPCPGCLVAAQAEHPLQARRADAVLLAGDEPHGEKPHPQRLARILQYSPGRQRCLPVAGATAQQVARHLPRLAGRRAVRADKAIRPPKPPDISPTRRLAGEPRVELLKRSRVINPAHGMPRVFHPATLSLAQTCVKKIPSFWNCVAVAIEYAGGLRNGALQSR